MLILALALIAPRRNIPAGFAADSAGDAEVNRLMVDVGVATLVMKRSRKNPLVAACATLSRPASTAGLTPRRTKHRPASDTHVVAKRLVVRNPVIASAHTQASVVAVCKAIAPRLRT